MADIEEKTKLLQDIDQETEFFTTLIDTIPPEHYGYDEETKELLRDRKHALVDQKLTAGKRAALSNKTKARLAQLDDRQCHTNSQISQYLLEASKKEKRGKKRTADQSIGGGGDSSAKNGGGQTNGSSATKSKKAKLTAPVGSSMTQQDGGGSIPNDRQHLLEKLQAKLDDMRAKRGVQPGATAALDYEEKKRLKRKLSKVKSREKRRAEKDQPKKTTPNGDNQTQRSIAVDGSKKIQNGPKSPAINNGQPSSMSKKSTGASPAGRSNPHQPAAGPKKPAIMDKDGRMVFSKFDFALPGMVEETTEKDKWAKKSSGKDYKRLLEKQERLEKKVERLEDANNPEAAKKLKDKAQWDAAAQRAKGAKVKDDTTLLKKNLKRKEKRKDQSEKKWDSRKDGVQKKQHEQQDKRRDNIQKRQKDKKDRKLTKARKKGRLV